MIVKLEEVITEMAESNKKIFTELENNHMAKVAALCDQHERAVSDINAKLLQTQEQSAKIANENAQFKKQVDILLSKNETLADVGEIQTEEINRLRSLPEEKQKFLSTQQLQDLNTRVDQLKLQLDEQKSQNVQLKRENEILQRSSIERQNLLQGEISGLRDQLSDLNTQNQLLMSDAKRHQEKALLSLVQPDEEKKMQLQKEIAESNLVMQERCVKAEREVERLRLSLQGKVDDAETAQRELA